MQRKSKYQVGQEFSNNKRLVELLGSDPKFRTSRWMWQCTKCSKIYGPSLINSITRIDRSPRCCFMPKGNQAGRWKGHEQLSGVWLYQYQSDAKKKGREFSVTPEQLWEIWIKQEGRCAYTNWPLLHGLDASLDRIDSALGYTVDNVQWVHRDINRMKSDFTEKDFLRFCKAVAKQSE